MISLLLTLFISLFSIGSPINSIDDPKENDIILQDSKPISNKVLVENQYVAFSADEFANEAFYNQLFTLYSSYTEEFNSSWHATSYCMMSACRNRDIDNPLTPGDNFLVQYRIDGNNSNIFTLFYSSDIVNNTRQYYGFMVGKYNTGNNQYTYHSWGVGFVSAETNPSNIGYTKFYQQDIILLGFCVYIPALYLSSDDLVLYNGLYTGFASEEGVYNDVASAYTDGYDKGYDSGYDTGNTVGYQTGYNDGLAHADYDSTALTVFTGIVSIALTPINMFLQIFNFEILGINLTGFISGILTLAVVVIIVRLILGGKKDD